MQTRSQSFLILFLVFGMCLNIGCGRFSEFVPRIVPDFMVRATATPTPEIADLIVEPTPEVAPVTEPAPGLMNETELFKAYAKASTLEFEGQLEAALAEYQSVARRAPESAFVQTRIGVLLQNLGRLEEAHEALVKALELAPEDHAANLAMGMVLYRSGKPELAEPHFEVATRRGSQRVKAYQEISTLFMAAGDYPKATDAYEKLLSLDPDAAVIYHYNLGQCYLRLNQADKAAEHLEAVAQAQPGHKPIYMTLGQLYERLKQYDKAIDSYRRLLEFDEGNLDARRRIAQIALAQGDHKTAFKEFTLVSEIDPTYLPAYHYLGLIYMQGSMFVQAE
ncbi:MAG TPA: tetratricopeptide repeat protein, partial [bacterium]|nr:tetratricopeptide repeat protein [bacterium]